MEFADIVGMTFKSVRNIDDERIVFETENGPGHALYHYQDCCESVRVEDICGELSDLENTPILEAEESTSDNFSQDARGELPEWTFYKIRTIKGSVTIRWYGESDYYSTSVSFI